MENINKLTTEMQQKIEQLKLEAVQAQQDLTESLNTQLAESRTVQNTLQQSQQQLAAQIEYGATVLEELTQHLSFDFSQEMDDFTHASQSENADNEALAQAFAQRVQEKIAFQLNELKAKTSVALQELEAVNQQISEALNCKTSVKTDRLSAFKRRIYQRFGKQIAASKACLAKQLELGAAKLRA